MTNLPVIAVLCLLSCLAEAWGPYTHQSLGKSLLQWVPSPSSGSNASFIFGNAAPDAYKSVSMVYHSATFAGYALDFAVKNGEKYKTDTFDPVAFAIGYGAHLQEDAVGHFPSKGFLNPAEDHKQEFACDSYFVHQMPFGHFEAIEEVPEEATTFITNVGIDYAASYPSFVPASHDALASSALDFSSTLSEEHKLALVNFLYKTEMVDYSRFSSSSFDEELCILKKAETCCQLAAQKWLTSMKHQTPENATATASSLVTSNFAEGLCN